MVTWPFPNSELGLVTALGHYRNFGEEMAAGGGGLPNLGMMICRLHAIDDEDSGWGSQPRRIPG